MEFMGKWMLWSPLADGYVSPGYNFTSGSLVLGLAAAHPVDMNDAIYNLYAAPKTGEAFMQAQCMWTGSCRPAGFISPPMWIRCDPSAAQNVSVTLTEDLASASSFTKQPNGDWSYLLCNSTPIYLNMVMFGLCIAVLGNPFGTSNPNMNITVITESLAFYRQKKSAANADFSHVDFRGVDLSGIDFTGANFNGAYMDAKTVFPAGTVFRNATFLGAAIVVMLVTGLMMRWPDPLSNDWRTGATFVHDWFALGVWLAVGGHILFALRDPTALHGMTRGTVTRSWARLERPGWFREMTEDQPDGFGVTTPGLLSDRDAKTMEGSGESPG